MHPAVFKEFERICKSRDAGGDTLEIGAVPSEESLLRLPALRQARSRVGVNLEGPSSYADFHILQADANDLSCFADASFDTVLSNSVFEHDRYFWKSLSEIRRVTRPGGLVVIGVPGFAKLEGEGRLGRLARVPVLGAALRRYVSALFASTPTLQIHEFPGDYYRFSPQAMREVMLEGLDDVEVRTLLVPPRVIGVGIR